MGANRQSSPAAWAKLNLQVTTEARPQQSGAAVGWAAYFPIIISSISLKVTIYRIILSLSQFSGPS